MWCNGHLCEFFHKLWLRGLTQESLPQFPLPAGFTMERFREAFGQYIAHAEEMKRRREEKKEPRR